MFSITTATQKVAKLSKRIRAIPGGTSASKTISIELVLINLSQSDKIPKLTSIVSESVPHLKRGAMRDFKNIMREHRYWNSSNWNATDSIYTFETGSQIEFFSSDNGDKLRGARRDRLFINEANNVTFDAFEQLEVRTKDFIFMDWNPTNEFWYYTEVKNKRTDVEECTLTYKDNEALSPQIVNSIEQRKNRPGWWQVYGEGKLGEVEGKIYKDWKIIDEIPHEAKLIRRGLDFGYSVDPTVIVDIYDFNGGYILDEQLYRKGLSNKSIYDFVENLKKPETLIIADSAEPKSIEELKDLGLTILGATKGPGSVFQGIQFVQDQQISITKRSTKTIKAYRNYLFFVDRDGRVTNIPDDAIHEWSNPMDAIRYGLVSLRKREIVEDVTAAVKQYHGEEQKILTDSVTGYIGGSRDTL